MILHHFGGGVYMKEAHIKAGEVLVQHKHNFEHMTILASGKVLVDGIEYQGPHVFVIPANANHGAKILEDCVWFCVHATESRDIDILDSELISPLSNIEEMRDIARTIT